MKRLTKTERMVLGTYNKRTDTVSRPEGLDDRQFAAALFSLSEQGLLKARHPLPDKWDITMTDQGRMYLLGNPELKNPFPWDLILRYMAIIGSIAAVLGLIIGCARLLAMS